MRFTTSIFNKMKHEEVVTALKKIAEKGRSADLSSADLQELITYNLIAITAGEEKLRNPTYYLTKKGRVMFKANSKPEPDNEKP
jgi:hypothetical protein